MKIEVPGYPESQMPARAEFYVQEAKKGELTELSCDGALLREIAEGAGGNFLREEEARDLIEQLKPLSKGKVIQHDTVLWQSYWWFAAIILLLTIEWLLRKRAGLL